jgi:hypothetical protein
MRCKICGQVSHFFGTLSILGKYPVMYFKCGNCGFIQTEEPHWLEEAYSSPISEIDIGSVNRAFTNSYLCELYILTFFDCNARFIDYGGGYGLLVRRMRDLGYDFYWYDKRCPNLFARTFEADILEQSRYELLTAFEVFEHFINPLDEIEAILNLSKNILFSTELIPQNNPVPGDWWYYGPMHGQHISFYTEKALSIIARRNNLYLTSDGKSLHLLTRKKIQNRFFENLNRQKVGQRDISKLRRKLNKKTLLEDDFYKISGMRYS